MEQKQPHWGSGWIKHGELMLIRVIDTENNNNVVYDWSITYGLPGLQYNEKQQTLGACTSMYELKCI